MKYNFLVRILDFFYKIIRAKHWGYVILRYMNAAISCKYWYWTVKL